MSLLAPVVGEDPVWRGLRLANVTVNATYANPNSTTTLNMVDYDNNGISSMGVIILASFTVAMNVLFFLPVYLNQRRRRRRAALEASLRSSTEGHPDGNIVEETLRYTNIESWVFCKTIVPHDELCDKLQPLQTSARGRQGRHMFSKKQRTSTLETASASDDHDGEKASRSSFSKQGGGREAAGGDLEEGDGNEYDDEEITGKECSICFDSLEPNDVASWSLDPTCNHIFHHHCIKQWLLKNQNCPFCRATFLPIDDASTFSSVQHRSGSAAAMQQVGMLLMAHKERSRPCFYCQEHGIVDIPRRRPASISLDEWETLMNRGTSCPSREELKGLRGEVADDEEINEEEEEEENDSAEAMADEGDADADAADMQHAEATMVLNESNSEEEQQREDPNTSPPLAKTVDVDE